ncbi:MAG: hypothetical protein Q9163_005710 [Psora crenata]
MGKANAKISILPIVDEQLSDRLEDFGIDVVTSKFPILILPNGKASTYADAVRQSVPLDVIDKIPECAKSATPYPAYQSNSEIPFVYEILRFEGWREMVFPVVRTWIEVRWLQAAKIGVDFL